MVHLDIKAFTKALGLNLMTEPLREAAVWYEEQFGHPDTVPQHLLLNSRLLDTSTTQLAAVLLLLDFTEANSEHFWIAKFYYVLPLAPGWTQTRDSLGFEAFVFDERTVPLHPAVAYLIVLARHHLEQAVKSPYLSRPSKRKNELHFHKEWTGKNTDVILAENFFKINQKIPPNDQRKVVSESIEAEFMSLRPKVVSKTGHLKLQMVFSLIARRVPPKRQLNHFAKVPHLLSGPDGQKLFNPSSVIRVRRLNQNYMQISSRSPSDAMGTVCAKNRLESDAKKMAELPSAVQTVSLSIPVSKSPKGSSSLAATKTIRFPASSKKENQVNRFRDADDRSQAKAFSKNSPTAKRPKSDFNFRLKGDSANAKALYFDLWAQGPQRGLRYSHIWSAIHTGGSMRTEESEKGGQLYQPGSTLLSFKAKAIK